MGISPARGRELQTWVLERVGYAFDKNAYGGSGVFVQTHDGGLALLTAAHVVIAAILSGELSIGAYHAGKAHFRPATCITLSSRSDAALVTADGLDVPVYLGVDDWNPSSGPGIDVGMKLVAGGLPGLWKGQRDPARRVVERSRVMLLWTEVSKVRQFEVEMVASRGLPSTLGGMSGGPLFLFDGQLVGIHMAESRGTRTRSLISTRREAWSDLHSPLDDLQWPSDLQGPPFRWKQPATYGPDRIPVVVGFEGWFGTSRSQPSGPRGSFGRIEKWRILNSEQTSAFPINMYSNFQFSPDDDDAKRIAALRWHVRDLLREMGFSPDV
jgi:hypothetical protein